MREELIIEMSVESCGVLKFKSCRRWEAVAGNDVVRCAISERLCWQQCEEGRQESSVELSR